MSDVLRVGSLGPNHTPTWRSADEPAPTVQTSPHGHLGPAGERGSGWLEVGPSGPVRPPVDGKPLYRVPSMAEINALPWNGFTAASTFSGCGGSSLGYRMAGFRIAWASEFVPAARDVYVANARRSTIVDGRDIRKVSVSEILDALEMEPGELDLLDGSPPCASFSTAGKRSAGWGQVNKYSDTEQRSDDLFFEFARLVEGIRPKTFVAENVSGLVKGAAKGYFKEIMRALKAAGYRVEARLLDAQWLGVPQARQRVIFVGVRNDLGLAPKHPSPLAYRYSVRDALSSQIAAVSTSKGLRSADEPSPTVLTHGNRFTQSELTAVVYRDGETGEKTGLGPAIGKEWDKVGPGGQSEKYFQLVRPPLDRPSPTVTAAGGTIWVASVTHPTERRKFTIEELRRICAFPDDFVLTGTYAQRWERLGRAVPPVMMSHVAATVRDEILRKIPPARSGS